MTKEIPNGIQPPNGCGWYDAALIFCILTSIGIAGWAQKQLRDTILEFQEREERAFQYGVESGMETAVLKKKGIDDCEGVNVAEAELDGTGNIADRYNDIVGSDQPS